MLMWFYSRQFAVKHPQKMWPTFKCSMCNLLNYYSKLYKLNLQFLLARSDLNDTLKSPTYDVQFFFIFQRTQHQHFLSGSLLFSTQKCVSGASLTYLHVNGFKNQEQNDLSCLCLHLPLLF